MGRVRDLLDDADDDGVAMKAWDGICIYDTTLI